MFELPKNGEAIHQMVNTPGKHDKNTFRHTLNEGYCSRYDGDIVVSSMLIEYMEYITLLWKGHLV